MANRDLTKEERVSLEKLVDAADLRTVLMALSEICGEKAEHVRTNWADQKLARCWDHAGGLIGVMVTTVPGI